MTFLNPLVLFGLAAAAIPLVIHLFNFRRPKKVDFSSLAFVKALEKRTMKRVRLKQWLLLALRMLAIAALVCAFARPTLQGGAAGVLGQQAERSVALILDNSLSMTLRDPQGAYLEQAKTLAGGVLDVLDPDDEVFLFTTTGQPPASVHAFATGEAAREAVAAVSPGTGPVPAARAVDRAATRLQEVAQHPYRVVYLVSDLQKSTWLDSLASRKEGRIPVHILPVGRSSQANVAVTDVTLESRIIQEGEPVQVAATLVNYGAQPLAGYTASAYLSDQRVAQATADLPVETPTEVTFTFTPRTRGWLPGRIQLGGDAFEQDNRRFFTLHVPRQRRLLLVGGRGTSTRYAQLALSSARSDERAPFVTETIRESSLAASDLSTYDVVVLVGPETLSSGEVDRLERYVREGGGLLFFPGAGAAAQDYNALFEALGGGRFTGFTGALGSSQPVASFERVDVEHPLFQGVFRNARGEVNVEEPRIYHAMNYAPASAQGQTLIELSNGFPFLQELRHGEGAAMLVAVAPSPEWSDLPLSGLFVPLLYRSSYYLSTGGSRGGDVLTVGRPGELRLSRTEATAPVRLVSPEGETFLPEQRQLYSALLLRIDGSIQVPGIYEIRQGEELVRRVAYNLDPRESDLAQLKASEAANMLASSTGYPASVVASAQEGLEPLKQALREQTVGIELWNVFLLLALVLLLAEMFVARQWRPEAAHAPVAA